MHPRDLDDLGRADWLTDDLGHALSQLGDSLRLLQACRRVQREDRQLAQIAIDGFATNALKLIDFLDSRRVGQRRADEVGYEDFVAGWTAPPLGAVLAGARLAASEEVEHGTGGDQPTWHFDEIVAALRARLFAFLDACGDAGLDVELLRTHLTRAFHAAPRLGTVALELPEADAPPAQPSRGSDGEAGAAHG